jgi:hypothetical protein
MDINEILQGTGNALIIVRRDDLIEFATTYAERMLIGQPKSPVKQELEKPISQTEAGIFLGKSRQTLNSWRKKGYINAYRISGRIYFKPTELISALEKLS